LAQALRDMKAACDGERRQRRQIAESGARQLSRAEAVLREAETRQRDAEAALRRARRMAAVGWMAAEACRDMTALHAVAARALTTSRERLQGDHRAVNEIDWALGGLNQAEQMLERVTAYLDARRENTQCAHIDGLLAGH
jgi:multidrug resistance efflux pump